MVRVSHSRFTFTYSLRKFIFSSAITYPPRVAVTVAGHFAGVETEFLGSLQNWRVTTDQSTRPAKVVIAFAIDAIGAPVEKLVHF